MAPKRASARLLDDADGRDDYGNDKDGAKARLLDFSKDALGKAAEIAADIAAKSKVCAAGCLAANLLIAKSVLDVAGARQLAKVQRRLPKLMDDLEYVCMVSRVSISSDSNSFRNCRRRPMPSAPLTTAHQIKLMIVTTIGANQTLDSGLTVPAFSPHF